MPHSSLPPGAGLIFAASSSILPTDRVYGVLRATFAHLVNHMAPAHLRTECIRVLRALLGAIGDLLAHSGNASIINGLVFLIGATDTQPAAVYCIGLLANSCSAVFTQGPTNIVAQAIADLQDPHNEAVATNDSIGIVATV
jgi:hypothetical protein